MNKNKTIEKYLPSVIEAKWQKTWEESKLYKAEDSSENPKFYTLIEFPYPSGAGLHVGHVRSWSAMDAYSRKKRMDGNNVLYPIGWDAFGLPAENYAIKNKIHPSVAVQKNIATFKRQIKSLGLSFDWSREVDTTDPKYYKWTQWIFLKFFEKGLAYLKDVPVNWCPFCKTTLADEEVLPDGTHERCGNVTEKKMQKQWLLEITKYADKLIDDLKLVDYSPKISQQQINWIGRKKGINITYSIEGSSQEVVCFTTRPDTNFGATFIVIGPEHPLIYKVTQEKYLDAVKEYVETAVKQSEIDRIAQGRKKTGVFTGSYAINNLNGKRLPIWVTDFVLGHVGTGAVVGVPAHDQRDYEFAKEFNIPIEVVVLPGENSKFKIQNSKLQFKIKNEWIDGAFEGEGTTINSDFLNGLTTEEAKEKIMDYLEEKGWGKRVVSYHLRDWVFSRQHYWGEPIPVVFCENCAKNKISNFKFQISNENGKEYAIVPVPEKDLPVELPYLEKYEPSGTGESPLANVTDWVNTSCPNCDSPAKRETDTMPNWAGSNWYFLRYLDSNNGQELADKKKMEYWMPVDLYQGGFEHTTLHLLYSRFVYKFLYDIGVVPTPEPYAKRRSHGIVLGPDGRKMSKSFGNVINPDEIVGKFGADTLRVYEMFMGPFEQMIAWSDEGVEGCFRFLKRVWILSTSRTTDQETSTALLVSLHKTIKKVGDDLENLKFNTAVAFMMEFINDWQKDEKGLAVEDLKKFLLILAPFAPHITEELFFRIYTDLETDLRGSVTNQWKSIHEQSWPEFDKKYLVEDEVNIVIQVNGRVRDTIRIQNSESRIQNVVEEKAREREKVRKHLEGKSVKKVIYVEGKIINFVTN